MKNLRIIALIWGLIGGLIAGPLALNNYSEASLRALSSSGGSVTASGIATALGAEDTVTAFATGGQTNATALSSTVTNHRVSVVATAGDSVKLPAATAGQQHYLRNDGVAAMQVFGQATETINGVASATGISHPAGVGMWYVSTAAGKWTTTFNPSNPTFTGTITHSGHSLYSPDNTYDIGASGATRPRTLYTAGEVRAGTNVVSAAASLIYWDSRGVMSSPSDGVIRLTNNAQTDFSRLQFGGTTNAFPALRRTGAQLDVVNGDNTGWATFKAGGVLSNASVSAWDELAIPAGGTAGRGFKVSSATNFGVFFGSGVPTLSAAKGSLYLRSDGSTTNDRMYVNTDGGTTWTAVTTAS